MFGYVRIYKPELKIKDYEIYKAAYCSVCRALGRHYGVIARGLLSYDATFLYLYRAAISEAADCKYEKGVCPFNPLKKCGYICGQDKAFEFVASVTVILSYFKLIDSINDSGFFKRSFCRLALPYMKRKYKKAKALYPDFFKEHSELTMLPLERARNFDELLSGLHGTRYESIIKKAMNGKTEFSVQLLENVLYNYLYTEASSIICEKYKKGKKRDELLDFFRMRSDMKTIESIYRLKKYYGSGSDIHTGSFFNSGITSFSEKELASLLAASSPDEVLELLKKTRYGKYLPAGDMVIERKTAIMQLRINEKQLRYSTHPETVFLSYVGIMENEMQNVTHIIEGIRYSLPPEEIMKYLIKSDDK